MVVVDFATQVGPSFQPIEQLVAGNPCNPMIHNLAWRTNM